MARSNIATYIWMIDTIERRGRITLDELNRLWMLSPLSEGNPMPKRTFHNHRKAIEQMFNITLRCKRSTFEYYIDHDGTEAQSRMQRWLLDSMSISGLISDSQSISSRVILEDVPSARDHLPVLIDAMKQNHRIRFDYRSYKRANPTEVVLEPYFVKIFKQLWYVIGYHVKEQKVKTYALDRMSSLHIAEETFVLPDGIDGIGFFKDCFGISTSQGEAKDITLRVSSTQAKYFRALPLHHSQREEMHDSHSIFHYHMKLTYDLKEELMSHGSDIEVLSPPELKAQIVSELRTALAHYGQQ